MNHWIAVVDDESISLTNVKNLLSDENMRVSCLRSGKDLLKFLEKNTPDLILLDILMPEMDGFETYHALRIYEENAGKSNIPVIFLTGADDNDTERRGLKVGASDFIRKPINKDILLKRINNTISNSKTIETLTEEAITDKLTGFLNKAGGTKKLAECCKNKVGTLAIIDLDSFKLVNDLYGHDSGDRVLIAFADIVRHNTRVDDIPCRVGGDEFLVFFSDLQDEISISRVCERLNLQIAQRCSELLGSDYGIPIGVSMGVTLVPKDGTDFDTLFTLADNALYTVKQNGKHGYCIHNSELTSTFEAEDNPRRELSRLIQIVEERNISSDALRYDRETFTFVYHYLTRCKKGFGGQMYNLMFTLIPKPDKKDLPMNDAENKLSLILQSNLRGTDFFMRSKCGSFFAVLPNYPLGDAEDAAKNIIQSWNETPFSEDISIEYVLKAD